VVDGHQTTGRDDIAHFNEYVFLDDPVDAILFRSIKV
jgi:hypothetical protein